MALHVGERLGHFDVTAPLGRGEASDVDEVRPERDVSSARAVTTASRIRRRRMGLEEKAGMKIVSVAAALFLGRRW